MASYDDRIQQLRQKIARKKQLEVVLNDLRDQEWSLKHAERQLKAVMDREQMDVDRLEGRSLAAFFYSVVGKMDEKLTKEKQEAYAARVKYDAAARELSELEEDLQRKEAEFAALHGCEEEYQQLLREKLEQLKAAGGETGAAILRLEEKLANLEHQKKELREADGAGRDALAAADAVLSKLDSAQGWAAWDMVGGGMLSDIAKYSRLDEAQNAVETLQIQLRRFKTELADVTIETDMQVGVEGFLRFADYFFDNLFTDWAVMDQINQSMNQVSKTRTQINSVLRGLEDVQRATERDWAETREKLDRLIREAGIQTAELPGAQD